jgi:hypothetical protein
MLRRRLGVIGLLVCLLSSGAWAISWQDYTGNWTDPCGWVDKRLPKGEEEVQIIGAKSVCTLNTSTADWGVGQRLRVHTQATLLVQDGAQLLGAGWMRVGAGSAGTVNQTGGLVQIQDGSKDKARLGIGDSAGSDGLYVISGGTLTYANSADGRLQIGARGGKGKLTIVGKAATILMGQLVIPDQANGNGTLEFKVGAKGVTPLVAKGGVSLDSLGAQTTAALVVTATDAPPSADIVLVDNQGTTAVAGVFDTVNGNPAIEGALVVLGAAGKECTYALSYVGGTGNDIVLVYKSSKRIPLFLDSFDAVHDYVTDDLGAYDGILDVNHILALNASVSRPGALYLETNAGVWDPGPGPMLYKQVTGDFVATVKVVDFAGTAAAPLFHNDAGLLARDPNGAAENWVSVNYFPTWTAFVARDTKASVRTELGQTAGRWTGVDTYAIAQQYPFLQLERRGSNFHPRISADGKSFIPLTDPAYKGIYDPNDPNQKPLVISRPDLPATLQLGLMNATYDVTTGYVAFDDFRIDVPLAIGVLNPSFEADGQVIQGGTPKNWTGNLPGNSGVATGSSSATDGTYFFWQGNGSVLDQTTSEVIAAADVTYVLKVDVRNSWQGSPKISLYYDNGGAHVELGSASLPANGDTWPGPVTLELAVKTTAESVGMKLGIELSLANYPGNYWSEFDNVRLTLR